MAPDDKQGIAPAMKPAVDRPLLEAPESGARDPYAS